MGRAMVGKASLKAVRHSGLEMVGYGGIFVGGEGKLKNIVSDFAWYFEEWGGGLGVCRECLFWSLFFCFLIARSGRCTRCFGRIGPGARLDPVRSGCFDWFSPDHGALFALTMIEQVVDCRWIVTGL